MAGIRKLRKIQLGRESTAGTEVNSTTLWRGTGTIQDNIRVVFPEEDIGYISGVNRSYIPEVGGQLDLDAVPCTFEQILHLLEMGIQTATPVTTGGGNAYTYVLPTTATNTIKTYTVEGGDDAGEEQFLYGFASTFRLAGGPNEAVTMSGTILGRQVAPGTFTTGVTIPAVEDVLFNKGILALDVIGGSWGTTPKVSTFLGFDLAIDTGWRAVYTGDGQLYYTFIKNVGPSVSMDVVFEHDAIAIANKVDWRAKTAKLLEVKFTGTTLASTGATYSLKTIKIQLAGAWEKYEKLDERDGNDIVRGTFRASYDSTGAKFGNIIVVNDLAAVP